MTITFATGNCRALFTGIGRLPNFRNYILLILGFMPLSLMAQSNKQNIRGAVVDKLSLTPIAGAVVQVTNDTAGHTVYTDSAGRYVLTNMAPGRYELRITNGGYKTADLSNIIVASGKETILDVNIEENFKRLKEVVVKGSGKAGAINKLATVSARTFSMEEVNRYAGGRSDPARLVANFAGVSAPDDSRNDIVIRGNSPVGVLWRIDGMNVTNPNHFATVGTTGGAVSALNTNMLKNSDFFTSAFPAEYGNAVAGVFDLGFRSGNTEKREHTLQVGLITGLEGMSEGPIGKGSGASYLVAYRQSVAFLASTFGINIGTSATPSYRDLSFKINSGNTKLGTFSLFGILANSSIAITGGKTGSLYAPPDNTDLYSAIGIIGLKHVKILNPRSYITSSLGINYSKNTQEQSTADTNNASRSIEDEQVTQNAYVASVAYNHKVNSRLFFKVGIQDQLINLDLYYRIRRNMPDWLQIWDNNSSTHLAQAYGHMKYNINEKLTANVGLNAQKLFLNTKSISVEPRIGLKYDVGAKSSFSAGFGLHSQMQPANIYYNQRQNASTTNTNKELGFTKSQHYVLGYDWQPFKNWRLKAEVYYQYLYDVPVDSFSSSYSMLNTGSSFKPDLSVNLQNNGTGTNYGAELTIEKFFSNGYYGLFTSSVYESKYKGSDGVEHNTAFNGKYVYNVLVGKEFRVGADKRNKFTTDLKYTNAGGRYHTPIDLAASQQVGNTVLTSDVYSASYDNYLRLDFKVSFALNSKSKKLSQTFSLDLQNITNHQNVFSQSYDNGSKALKTSYQLGFFPNFIYKLQF